MVERTYSDEIKNGDKVLLKGWVHDVRTLGGINFVLLRDKGNIIQVTAAKGKTPAKFLSKIQDLHQEDIIAVTGKVVKNKKAPGGLEVIPSKIEIISKSETPLPLDPRGVTKANLDTKLDYRYIDLRKPENFAIFKIQSHLTKGMIEYLRKEEFMQVFTPSLLGGISEGGSEVFSVVYFDKQAYLRQDPQLHRELLINSGFEKIFDIGPSWRAEKSHTIRHLTEHRTIAPEMTFIKDEMDTIKLEEAMIVYALKKVKKECSTQLELLGKKIKIPKTPFPELRFPKVYDILLKMGKKIPVGEDYDRESEKLLGEYVKKKYKSDFFFVNRFPFAAKPFYVMRVDEEPKWARSVDLMFKGMELSSGGQREHRHEKIIEQIKEKKLSPDSLKWFTDSFKYGAPPMGGLSLGIERLTQQLLDLENVREATLFPRDPKRLLP
jgi:nondiscriminating aspartyl-tRNA synthetase